MNELLIDAVGPMRDWFLGLGDWGVALCFSGASITSTMSRARHSWNSGNTAGFAA